jgi:hypothetical protein
LLLRKIYTKIMTEPNTGLMLIRATSLGVEIMRRFLSLLVDENRANDQPCLTDSLGFKRTTDCHYNYSKTLSQNAMKEGLQPLGQHLGGPSPSPNFSSIGNGTATLCLLQEVLFQNGNLAFGCAEREQTKMVR